VGLAHAPGAAGDQRDLAVEPTHALLRIATKRLLGASLTPCSGN
jgi:hypothetical protein